MCQCVSTQIMVCCTLCIKACWFDGIYHVTLEMHESVLLCSRYFCEAATRQNCLTLFTYESDEENDATIQSGACRGRRGKRREELFIIIVIKVIRFDFWCLQLPSNNLLH